MSTSMGSQASESSGSVPPTSVRKKRIACDNCHSSKVRCTGEVSGCQRCRRGQKTCHYSESNMGRMPAGGAAKRRKPSAGTSTRPSTSMSMSTGKSPDAFMAEVQGWGSTSLFDGVAEHHHQQPFDSLPIDRELQSPGFDPLVSTFDDLEFSDVDDGHFDAAECPLDVAFTRTSAARSERAQSYLQQQQQQQQQQHLQLEPTQLFDTPAASIAHSYADSGVEGSDETSTSSFSSPDAGGVRYWAAQLDELSRPPNKVPIPLDNMLHHSSRFLPRVAEALRSLASQSNASSDTPLSAAATSLVLILLGLTQAITLFEQCIPSVLASSQPPSSSSGSNAGASSVGPSTGSGDQLSLRLGEFRIDAESQQALQVHLVGRELSTILQACKLIRQTLLQPAWRGVPKRTHGLLLEDLRVRTLALICQMKQKRGAPRMLAL